MVRCRALLMMLAAVTGCSETLEPGAPSAVGSAEMAVTLQGGATLESVQYVVTNGSDKGDRGSANVDVTVDTPCCPEIDGITIAPSSAAVGATLWIEGRSTIEGAEFLWSAPQSAGTFSRTTSAQTNFTCASEGHHKLSLELSKDGCPTATEEVDIECTRPGPGTSSSTDICAVSACRPGTSCSYELSEGQNCKVSCAEGSIASVSVTYADNCMPLECPAAAPSSCVGTDSCSVSANNTVCGTDPCPGTPKTSKVVLTCSVAGSGTGCEVAPCQPGTSCSYQFTEEQSCMVSCADSSIASVSVTYADNCMMPLDCPAAAPSCVGTDSCSVSVSNTVCGTDPCPGTPKFSKVDLTCSVAGSGTGCEVAPCQAGTSCSYQFTEEQSCMVSCADSSIASVSVAYADNCMMPLDCPAAAPSCAGADSCNVSVGNNICGTDPCPGVHKFSNVMLTCGPAGSGGNKAP